MLQFMLFILYTLWLVIFVILLSINTVRIGVRIKANPRSVTLLLPLLINFITSSTLFRTISPFFTLIIMCVFVFLAVRKLENVRIFGLTGGTATGKSTLIKMIYKNLKPLQIIDIEKILENELKKGRKGYKVVISLFQNETEQFLDLETQEIEKQKFTDFLYSQNNYRQAFSHKVQGIILWPVIKMIMTNILNKRNLMIINAPSIYRYKFLKWIYFPKVVVTSEPRRQAERAQAKWNCTERQAKERLTTEIPLMQTQSKEDILIKNNTTEEEMLNDFLTKLMPFMNKSLNHYSHLGKK